MFGFFGSEGKCLAMKSLVWHFNNFEQILEIFPHFFKFLGQNVYRYFRALGKLMTAFSIPISSQNLFLSFVFYQNHVNSEKHGNPACCD